MDEPIRAVREEVGRAEVSSAAPGLSFSPRRPAFWIAWVAAFSFAAWMNALSTTRDLERRAVDFIRWEPFAWELTSMVATVALLPLIVGLVERRPWAAPRRPRTVGVYAVAAFGFSVVHVGGMVGLRKIVYGVAGLAYDFGAIGPEFLYELRKDAVTFLLLVTILNLLREVERRLVAPVLAPAAAAPSAARIAIRDGNKEIDLDPTRILAVRAAGNYVEVYRTGDKPLMARATLADIEARLGALGFVRVHRSWVIAIDRVVSVSASSSGDFRARLPDGLEVPVSRRYKDAIRHLRT